MWGNCQNTPTVLTLRWMISLETEYAVLYVSWTYHRMRHQNVGNRPRPSGEGFTFDTNKH